MTKTPDPKKPPQWQNDLAVVMRVAVGGRNYVFTTRYHDNAFTHKMQRQFGRVAKAVRLELIVGTQFATLRDPTVSRGAPALLHTETPRQLAVRLLDEYAQRGGRMA